MAYLAPSLKRLFREVDGRWPHRDRASDGWLGDRAHRRRRSDHNPDWKGCVHAVDIDATTAARMGSGTVGDAVLAALLAGARGGPLRNVVHYIIYRGRIYHRRTNFASRPYSGSNPHTSHVHVSILHRPAAELRRGRWGIGSKAPSRVTHGSRIPPKLTPAISLSALARNDRTSWKRVQARLNRKMGTKLVVDGIPGQATRKIYSAWQRRCGYSGGDANGVPGATSLRRLGFRVKR